MANQVSGIFQPGNSNGSIGQGQNFFNNGGNGYGVSQFGVNNSGVQSNEMVFQNFTPQFQASSSQPQCPISQSQCEQLLSYLSVRIMLVQLLDYHLPIK